MGLVVCVAILIACVHLCARVQTRRGANGQRGGGVSSAPPGRSAGGASGGAEEGFGKLSPLGADGIYSPGEHVDAHRINNNKTLQCLSVHLTASLFLSAGREDSAGRPGGGCHAASAPG